MFHDVGVAIKWIIVGFVVVCLVGYVKSRVTAPTPQTTVSEPVKNSNGQRQSRQVTVNKPKGKDTIGAPVNDHISNQQNDEHQMRYIQMTPAQKQAWIRNQDKHGYNAYATKQVDNSGSSDNHPVNDYNDGVKGCERAPRIPNIAGAVHGNLD